MKRVILVSNLLFMFMTSKNLDVKTTVLICDVDIDITKLFTVIEEPQVLYDSIAYYESRGKYDIANTIKMLGKYQFSKSALIDASKKMGFSKSHIEHARNSIRKVKGGYVFDTIFFNKEVQDKIFESYMDDIENVYMKKYIDKYEGTYINGVRISKAGILFASMLGFGHVRNYLKSNGQINFSDSYGTSIEKRLKKFSMIDLQFMN